MPNRTDSAEERSGGLLKPAEAMARLQVSRQTLTRYADSGQLSVVVLPSGHRRYRADEVAAIENGVGA